MNKNSINNLRKTIRQARSTLWRYETPCVDAPVGISVDTLEIPHLEGLPSSVFGLQERNIWICFQITISDYDFITISLEESTISLFQNSIRKFS